MTFNKFIAPLTAIVFGLATMTPSIAATFSKPSVSTSSRSFAPAPPIAPRAPSDSASGFTKPRMDPPVARVDPPASNNGFTKPTVAPQTTTQTNNGFTKPTVATTPTPPAKPPVNALAAAQQKTMSASTLQQYQAQRAQAKLPPQTVAAADLKGNPGFTAARSQYGSMDSYMAQRQNTYSTYSSSHPQAVIIVHEIHPNYGVYDSLFLTAMIMGSINAQNAAWMAAQQNQAWYAQYRADLDRQAQDNAELRAQIAQMDAEMAAQRAAGNTTNVGALPPGVDPSVAIAPEAMMADFSQTPATAKTSNYSWMWLPLGMLVVLGLIYFVMRRRL